MPPWEGSQLCHHQTPARHASVASRSSRKLQKLALKTAASFTKHAVEGAQYERPHRVVESLHSILKVRAHEFQKRGCIVPTIWETSVTEEVNVGLPDAQSNPVSLVEHQHVENMVRAEPQLDAGDKLVQAASSSEVCERSVIRVPTLVGGIAGVDLLLHLGPLVIVPGVHIVRLSLGSHRNSGPASGSESLHNEVGRGVEETTCLALKNRPVLR
jgi:hypothetical protein